MKENTSEHATRILIVDDDAQITRFLRDFLEGKSFVVKVAHNGDDALSQCATFRPHLILTDIYMPESEGIGLIVKFRMSDKTTPIIAMSGEQSLAGPDYLRSAELLGANGRLLKPFSASELLTMIRSLLHAG